MIRGIPKTITVVVPVDLSGASAAEMWIRDAGSDESICRDISELDIKTGYNESRISYTLSEEEALSIRGFYLFIQCRWITAKGESGTFIEKARVEPALWDTPVRMRVDSDG